MLFTVWLLNLVTVGLECEKNSSPQETESPKFESNVAKISSDTDYVYQSIANTLQVDGLAHITGRTQASHVCLFVCLG